MEQFPNPGQPSEHFRDRSIAFHEGRGKEAGYAGQDTAATICKMIAYTQISTMNERSLNT